MTSRSHSPNRTVAARGQTTVEAALSIPLIVILTLGVAQLARVVYAYTMVAEAARDATRYAAVHGGSSASPVSSSNTSLQSSSNPLWSVVATDLQGLNTGSTYLTVSTSFPQGNNTDGSTVKVTVTYDLPVQMAFVKEVPFVTTLLKSITFGVSSTSQMQIVH